MAVREINSIQNSDDLESNLKSLINLLNSEDEVKIIEEEIYYNTAKNFGKCLNVKDYDMLITKVRELGIGQAMINFSYSLTI